jgi:uncharacterized protein with von Willebrand factor type A (vWA) domain
MRTNCWPPQRRDEFAPEEKRVTDAKSRPSGAGRRKATVAALPAAALAEALREKAVGFCRLARHRGFRVGLRETQDVCRVTALFLVADFAAFRDGLRALFCQSPDDSPVFDRLFTGYWCPADPTEAVRDTAPEEEVNPLGTLQAFTLGLSEAAEKQSETHTLSGASGLEALAQVDFSLVPAQDLRELERVAQKLWERMSTRLARRLTGRYDCRRLDLRRTMRRNMVHGGEPLRLVMRGWRPRRPRLVLLLDVSGSMELYSLMLLRLAHALQQRFRKVSSFVFSTRLADVTRALKARRPDDALAAVSALRPGWSGGTRIGECLDTFARHHAGRLLRPDTVLIVLSDGLDVGEPEHLARCLGELRRRVGRVVWLNPLLGMDDYEPTAGGMQAALPLVDVFAPAHNLASLAALERILAQ